MMRAYFLAVAAVLDWAWNGFDRYKYEDGSIARGYFSTGVTIWRHTITRNSE